MFGDSALHPRAGYTFAFGAIGGAFVFIVLVLAFALVGCGDDDDNGDLVPDGGTPNGELPDAKVSEALDEFREELTDDLNDMISVANGELLIKLESIRDEIAEADETQLRVIEAKLNGIILALLANNANSGEGSNASGTPDDTKTTSSSDLKGTGTKPAFVTDFTQGEWTVHGTERLADNPVVDGWIKRLKNPAPELWKTFPNIPNNDVPEFRVVNGSEVPDGVEYGTYSTPYCFSHPCDVPVGAWEYRLITGDYHVFGYECKGDKKKGCLLLLINVMDQSVTFRDQDVDNGFTLRGRYWNGDALEWGVWGLVSHASANMLNMETFARPGEVLNSGDPGNSGANCGIPEGCGSVDARVIVVGGDAAIAVLETTVVR